MFQPRLKLEFIRLRFPLAESWCVCVDIDASEEGRTGGPRKTKPARTRQREMTADAQCVRQELNKLGVQVGARKRWLENLARSAGAPKITGDRDVIAYNIKQRRLVIAEVEGESSGQPEQKLYKAIGQLVFAASEPEPIGWKRELVLVVEGGEIAKRAEDARCLRSLGISAVSVSGAPPALTSIF